jgi:hypothetical protein
VDAQALRERRASRLIEGVVAGAVDDELVQLHGSIVATLELFPVPDAVELVFDPSLGMLTGAARRRASVAMGEHLPLYFGSVAPADRRPRNLPSGISSSQLQSAARGEIA